MTTLTNRQQAILNAVDARGFVAIDQLAAQFNVTPQTIRRDINLLCDQNILQRFHGGAGRGSSTTNQPYADRRHALSPAKQRIAAAVAAAVPEGSSLFINIGTTTEAVARALLGHRKLFVVTNNLNVATILAANDGLEIMIAGGRLRHRDGGIIGVAASDFIRQFRLDFGIIGVSGIDERGALLDFDYDETKTAAAIIASARATMLVTDHSKFGRPALTRFADVADITHLYTDRQPPEPYASRLRDAGVVVHVAEAGADGG